jgi:hypothetical protein
MCFSFSPGAAPDPKAPWIQEAMANHEAAQAARAAEAAEPRQDRPLRRRARIGGRFRADNPATPADEAWEGPQQEPDATAEPEAPAADPEPDPAPETPAEHPATEGEPEAEPEREN